MKVYDKVRYPLPLLLLKPPKLNSSKSRDMAELKELNEWPTFPQLIIKGEFCGGLDVIKEMQESGELQEMIKG